MPTAQMEQAKADGRTITSGDTALDADEPHWGTSFFGGENRWRAVNIEIERFRNYLRSER